MLMLGVVGSTLTVFKLEPTSHNMSQHFAKGWPNARDILRPTMLRYAALTRCDLLAGALPFKTLVHCTERDKRTRYACLKVK